jgi:hypothetical protein
MPSLVADYTAFRAETMRLTGLIASTSALAPAHRKFIAEIALLRLAILIENSMRSVFCKISCGATYINGNLPIVLAHQRNIPAAISAMRNLSRPRFRYSLPWNDGAEIRDNIQFVIDPADGCHQALKNYAGFLTEIRWIRNHIAHRNDNSRNNFVKLIRRYYGAKVPGVTCGNLLVSPRVSRTRPLLETHIITANVMMKDIVRA